MSPLSPSRCFSLSCACGSHAVDSAVASWLIEAIDAGVGGAARARTTLRALEPARVPAATGCAGATLGVGRAKCDGRLLFVLRSPRARPCRRTDDVAGIGGPVR